MTSVPGRIGAGASAPIGLAVAIAVGWTTMTAVGDACRTDVTVAGGEERSPIVGVVMICGAVAEACGAAAKGVACRASDLFDVGASQLASSISTNNAAIRNDQCV